MPTTRSRFVLDGHDVARLAALFWTLAIGTYLGLVLERDLADPQRLTLRDYFCFHRAGELFREGGTGYEQLDRTFANPPFALPLAALVSLAGPTGAFFASNALSLAGLLVGMLAIARVEGMDSRYHVTALSVALACPSFVFALHLGQWTGLYIGLAGLVIHGWCVRRDVMSGIAAGLLWLKPPLALALVAVGSIARPRRFVVAWTSTLAFLVVATAPLGLDTWRGFFDAAASLVERHEANPDSWRKQLTIYAFLRMLAWMGADDPATGRAASRFLAFLIAAAVGAFGAQTAVRHAAAWRALRDDPALSMRLGSIALLATVSLNFYLFYYDAALVMIPTLFLAASRARWRSPVRWWLAALCAIAAWSAQLLPMFWRGGPNPAGVFAGLWLVLELLELRATFLRMSATRGHEHALVGAGRSGDPAKRMQRLPEGGELALNHVAGGPMRGTASTTLDPRTSTDPLSATLAVDSDGALGATLTAPWPQASVRGALFEHDASTNLRASSRASVLPRISVEGDELVLSASEGPRYAPLRTLGRGGMGEVDLVEDRDIGREVAVKRLLPEHAGPASIARFVDEVRIVGSLEHPNIVPIHDVGVDEHGRYFFVMKYLDGETLESILERLAAGDPEATRRFDVPRRVQVFIQILRALEFAHARGVIHRDVKPANVMVGRFGEVVLMDWGVARTTDTRSAAEVGASKDIPSEIGPGSRRERASTTRVGALVGTPLYMSPEQARGENAKLDARSDLYSAALVLHEMLSLRHLRASCASVAEVLEVARTQRPPSVGAMFGARAGVGLEYAYFLRKALALDPADRFQSATEMIDELHRVAAGRFRVHCPATFMKRGVLALGEFIDRAPRAAMWLGLGGVAALAALVVLGILSWLG